MGFPLAAGPYPSTGVARTRAELLVGARERDADPLRRRFDMIFDAPGSKADLREAMLARLTQLMARLGSLSRRDPSRTFLIDGTQVVLRVDGTVVGWIDTAARSGIALIDADDERPLIDDRRLPVASGRGETVLRIATWWAAGMPDLPGRPPTETAAVTTVPIPDTDEYVGIPTPETTTLVAVVTRLAEAAAAAASVPSSVLLDSLGPERPPTPDDGRTDRTVASLLGGALGDALGAPIEFSSAAQLSTVSRPMQGFLPLAGAPLGAVTDDTQMSLFTAEALADPAVDLGDGAAVRLRVARAYLDWYSTQGEVLRTPTGTGSALIGEPWLHARRAPGTATMAALGALAHDADADLTASAQNDSKGCGTVMRSAPFGMPSTWSAVDAFRAAASCATITHAHPEASFAAAAFASLIACLLEGGDLLASVWTAIRLTRWSASHQTLTGSLLERSVALAALSPGDPDALATLGEGWVAEEALAIAVYSALSYPAADGVADALSLSVLHGGDSDSTGAICGNIVGAAWGTGALPPALVTTVEGRSTIEETARHLARREDHP